MVEKTRFALLLYGLIFLLSICYVDSSIGQQFGTINISPSEVAQTDSGSSIGSNSSFMQPGMQQEGIEQTGMEESFQPPSPSQPDMLNTQVEVESVEGMSEFEQLVSGIVQSGISTRISQFGYKLFKLPSKAFDPPGNLPVGPNYVVGPGDEIRIVVWGKVEGGWTVWVDRNGNVSLPKIGVIGVTGLTFQELKELLHHEFSKFYTGFNMNVSMGTLRTMKVYVVGNVVRPGAYTVSSLSSIVNALLISGGPNKTGSMRDVQIKRNGKTIASFDMYDLLLKGDKSGDIRLVPEDVIFIPPVGPLVGIAGHVKRPAIYELQDETKLLDLIDMAGGLTSRAFKGRIQIQRIQDNQFRTQFESDLLDIESIPDKNFSLNDGDLVKIFSVVETSNFVRLSGAVVNEGSYAIVPGESTVSDVITKAGGLLYHASDQAELTRVRVSQEGPVTNLVNIDVSKALQKDPEHNIVLEINDYIFIRNVPEWRLYNTVFINGEVKYPGTYTIRKGEKISSLVKRAGGFTEKAYLRGAVFIREKVRQLQQSRIDEMVLRLEAGLLSKGAADTAAAISAEEAKIKELEVKQKMEFIKKLKMMEAKGRMAVKMDSVETIENSQYDLELESMDSLFIPSNPQSVQVLGAVFNRTAFIYEKGRSVQGYVDMAGGYTDTAEENKVYVLKVDGTAVQPQSGMWGSLSWDNESNMWGAGYAALEPGDTVVVPEKLEKVAWMREMKDITQILYQIATTAGVLIVAF